MTTSDPYPDLDSRILRLVHEYWEEHQTPLLLSQLGGRDGGDIAKLAKQRADTLAAYLRDRLSDRVRVIQHSAIQAVIGAIPAEVDTGTNGDSIDALLDRTRDHTVRTIPRFHSAFWTAFKMPLEESRRRYLSVRAPIRFQDVASEHQPDDFVEIERKYIASLDAEAVEVHKMAQDWLSDNRMEATPFLWQSKTETTHLPPNDLLGRLLLALEPDELGRVSMPLDIVSKLRRESL